MSIPLAPRTGGLVMGSARSQRSNPRRGSSPPAPASAEALDRRTCRGECQSAWTASHVDRRLDRPSTRRLDAQEGGPITALSASPTGILCALAITTEAAPHQRLAVVARGGSHLGPLRLASAAPGQDRQAPSAEDGPRLVHDRSRRPRLFGRRGRQIEEPDEAGRPTWTPTAGVGKLQSLARGPSST